MVNLRRTPLLLLALTVLAKTAQAEPRLFIKAGSLSRPLKNKLQLERPSLSFTATTADASHLILLDERPASLSLEVQTVEGQGRTRIAERQIPLSDGLEPALRLSVLLILKALTLSEELDLGPRPPPPSPKMLGLVARASGIWWQSPALPQLGLGLGVQVQLQPYTFELRVDLAGRPCCKRNVAGLEGSSRELLLLAQAGWRFWRAGRFGSRALVALGANFINLEFTPKVRSPDQPFGFFDRAPSQTINQTQLTARLGASLEIELAPELLFFSVALGGQLKLPSVNVDFPDEAAYHGNPLKTGVFLPWIEGGIYLNFL